MRRRLMKLHRRFLASTGGVAAIEFAMILPVLATLFLATFDGGRAIAVYMKVRSATYALAAVTNQYSTIQSSDMTSITGATAAVMAPYSSSGAAVTITQIAISSSGKATVSWSYSQGGTAMAQGSAPTIPIPTALVVDSTYLIFAQVSYTFTPLFGYFTKGNVTFSDNLYVTPRVSNCINYPPQSVTTCVMG
jgi:Flp pilus assembly protein TadG